jgi:hypothetical protein
MHKRQGKPQPHATARSSAFEADALRNFAAGANEGNSFASDAQHQKPPICGAADPG